MVERTLVDEIISIIHSEANNNPLPVKCTIHETYPNGLIDVLLENGTILTYLPVIGSPRVGDTGVLLYLDDEKNNQIIITNGGSGGGSTDVSWGNILNKPSTFPPSTHTHLSSDVTDFDLDSIEDNLRYEVLCFTDNTLSTECYNFDIDSTVYIIVTAFNVYGDSVSVGSSEVLTVNTVSGVSSLSGSQRVTYNGVETNLYVYSASEWGQCRFSIKTYDSFINVSGWKSVASVSGKYSLRTDGKIAELTISSTGHTFKSNRMSSAIFTLDTKYRPISNYFTPIHTHILNAHGILGADGVFKVYSSQDRSNQGIYAVILYRLANPLY